MTSNVGARELERSPLGFGARSVEEAGQGDEAYKRLFAPEFRNRLDARVTLQRAVPRGDGAASSTSSSPSCRSSSTERKVTIELTTRPASCWPPRGTIRSFGARPLGRVIQRRIKRQLSEEVLFGELSRGGVVTVDAVEGELTISCVARRRRRRG